MVICPPWCYCYHSFLCSSWIQEVLRALGKHFFLTRCCSAVRVTTLCCMEERERARESETERVRGMCYASQFNQTLWFLHKAISNHHVAQSPLFAANNNPYLLSWSVNLIKLDGIICIEIDFILWNLWVMTTIFSWTMVDKGQSKKKCVGGDLLKWNSNSLIGDNSVARD